MSTQDENPSSTNFGRAAPAYVSAAHIAQGKMVSRLRRPKSESHLILASPLYEPRDRAPAQSCCLIVVDCRLIHDTVHCGISASPLNHAPAAQIASQFCVRISLCQLLKGVAIGRRPVKSEHRIGTWRVILQRTSCGRARQRRCASRKTEDPATWMNDESDGSQEIPSA